MPHGISVPLTLATFAAACSLGLASDCTRTSVGKVPINDLGTGLYLGQFPGGLYPDGSNVPPLAHATAVLAAAHSISPLSLSGLPDAAGKYVLLSIGLSNTTQEFCGGNPCPATSFAGMAAADSAVNHTTLAIVDGASGGQSSVTWDEPTDANYDRVRDTRLATAGLSEQQVRIAWLKIANPGPTVPLPAANAEAYTLVTQMGDIVRSMKTRYPNLELVFVSSRIYAGYASSTLNPEPYAYESGFAVKWLIEAQINQIETGTADPRAGDLDYRTGAAPVIVWGPYMWADGLTPRSDGLIWNCSEFNTDGTHPAVPGRQKVGLMLMDRFANNPDGWPWFRVGGLPPCGSCPGDADCDGDADSDDVVAFFGAWDSGDEAADVDADGDTDSDDIVTFFASWDAGC